MSPKIKWTTDNIKIYIEEHHKKIKLINIIKNNGIKSKIKILYIDCNHEYVINFDSLLRYNGSCNICAKKNILQKFKLKWSNSKIIKFIKNKRKNFLIINIEKNNGVHTKVKFKYNTCGHIFVKEFDRIRSNLGCIKCRHFNNSKIKLVWNLEKIKNWILKENSVDFLKYISGSGNKTKILVMCKKCENIYEVSFYNLLNGRGCVNCSKGKFESFVINTFKDVLKKEYNKIIVDECQKIFPDLIGVGGRNLRFDYYCEVKNKKICLEAQGEQHYYKDSHFFTLNKNFEQFKIYKEHDIRKKNYCKNNNIYFIEIFDGYVENNKLKRYSKKQIKNNIIKVINTF